MGWKHDVLYKHEELNVVPQHPQKPGVALCACRPRAGGQKQVDPRLAGPLA